MSRRLSIGCLLVVVGAVPSGRADAQVAKCPTSVSSWIEVVFSGTAWSPAQEESVVRELRIELGRRSFEVCAHTGDAPPSAPNAVVTLLTDDADRISIVPSRMLDEGGFSGRTIRVGSIPEDARYLAIAQAVDEVLRAEPPASPPIPPPAREIAVQEALPPPSSPSRLGVALAPTLLVAPNASTGANKTALTAGASLRASLTRENIGGSIGLVLGRSTDLVFGSVTINQFRLPVDASFRVVLRTGQLEGALDAGLVLALLHEAYGPAHRSLDGLDIGGRAGLTFTWGNRIVPWIGTSIEVMPSSYDLRFAPMGAIGHTSTLWLGFSIGMAVRWR